MNRTTPALEDAIAVILTSPTFANLDSFEQNVLRHLLQQPEPRFQLRQQVKHKRGKLTGRVVGFLYQSLTMCFSDDGDEEIGWSYHIQDSESGEIVIHYEDDLEAVEA